MANYVLGLDSSTQSLTALLVDADENTLVREASLNFDEALPHYGTCSGALPHDDPHVVHSPPLMWVEALDQLFARMHSEGWPLSQVRVIAGSGQQHGTVYLKENTATVLAQLDAHQSLKDQLSPCLSRGTSPIWLDSSTAEDCQALTEAVGSEEKLWASTGSPACERFSGPQIRRFFRTEPEAYAETAHILLVSSFLCSVLAGSIAPTDHGDGSGMNLLDLKSLTWNMDALGGVAPDLSRRIGETVPSSTVVSSASAYFVQKYGLCENAKVMAWSGDNPNSQVGLGLVDDGDCALSMGTSDVLFATLKNLPTSGSGEGHIFCTPTGDFMSLLCFSNGSLAREAVRDLYGLDWSSFDEAVARSPVGNEGKMMLPWFCPETVPKVLDAKVHRKNLKDDDIDGNCRAVLEGQMLSRRLHAQGLGIEPKVLKVTGGASKNRQIVRIAADVFNCPVQEIDVAASAALGAALRALHVFKGGEISVLVEPFVGVSQSTEPIAENVAIYENMLKPFSAFEKEALG